MRHASTDDATVRDLNHLTGLGGFLSHRDNTLIEILNYCARVVFSDADILQIGMCQYNEKSGTLVNIGLSGARREDFDSLSSSIQISEKHPGVDSFKSGEIICIPTLPDWGDEYQNMQDSLFPLTSRSYLAVPVFVSSIPTAVLSMFSADVLELDDRFEAFLRAVSSIVSMHLYRNIRSYVDDQPEHNDMDGLPKNVDSIMGTELTERQSLILRLISEDRTNKSISQFLGYSESVVRQDVIKIFAKLGCSNRSEASQIYLSYEELQVLPVDGKLSS